MLVSNHMDVVPAGVPAEWARPPFSAEIAQGRIWGRGTTDMKGATSAQLNAFKVIAEIGQPEGDVIIACTVDDETAGEWGMNILSSTALPKSGGPCPAFIFLANQPASR